MALKDHKKGITKAFIIMLILFLLCFGVFSCSTFLADQGSTYINMDYATLVQLDEPEPDAPAMRMHTTAGDIVAELYPEQAPKYVEQFQTLAESGYYDDTYVFQVESGVYFEAGTPNADGTLKAGTDATYEKVEREVSADIWPLRGAFCAPVTMQDGGFWDRLTKNMTSYCGTRFAVCNTIEFDADAEKELASVSEQAKEISDAFLERGGIPNYSQQMTIFAQAYGDESFETIEKISNAALKTATSEGGFTAPQEDILITGIEFGSYAEMSVVS